MALDWDIAGSGNLLAELTEWKPGLHCPWLESLAGTNDLVKMKLG
jgi:hypothetical protein